MRLKHLELQGYKTFASHTDFLFDSGITAIVGPNGSGKSNIADAIRWVLGEQSYRSLRGKRTEDMIFSGSAQRARLGMASASLSLDNADGWLPIDFSEVTITRRAYRSGENEYLLNNSRVRLRDITELLAKSGLARRTYTVVGQGLVDAVLSLRPDDRRALFEEAAGITLYQAKRAEALSRLEETRSNLVRVNDIINEISPRMRRLEREAERTRRHALLTQQLEGLLRTWYGFRWRQAQQNLRRSHDALSRREGAVARSRQALEDLDEQVAVLRARQSQLRERLGAWHRESGELHRQMEEVQRDLAVWRERARLLAAQRDEIQVELNELQLQAQALAERIANAEADLDDSRQVLQAQDALVAQAQAALDAHEGQRAALAQQMAEAQERTLDLATRAGDRRNRLAQLDERRTALAEERAEHMSAVAELRTRDGELRSEIEAVAAEQARLQSERAAVEARSTRLESNLKELQARQAELRTALSDAQRNLERLQARYDLLGRLREEGEGLRAGVRSVLQAARGSLSGIVGTVVQLLRVPAEYEVAIEVALGGHLQDIVAESWTDVDAAISFLREGRRGRATFLPLDTLRPAQRLNVPGLDQQGPDQQGLDEQELIQTRGQGVIGLGADLVRADEHLAPVVEMLLGRTIVTRDLTSARRTFERLQGGFQIVTLAGEVLRSSGSVTGGQGSDGSQGQVLAREREWRELPGQLDAAAEHCDASQATLDAVLASEDQVRSQSAALGEQLADLDKILIQVQAQQRDLERDAEEVGRQMAWQQAQLVQLDTEAAELDTTETSLQDELARLDAEKEASEGTVAALQAELDGLRGEVLYQRLSEVRTAAATARGRREQRQSALDTLHERQASVQTQSEAKSQRIAELEGERASLSGQIGRRTSRETVIQGWLASLAHKIDQAEAEIANLESEREELNEEETTLRSRLRQAQESHSQAFLAQSRQQDRLDRLRDQIMDDFGLVEMELAEGLPEQPPLPLGEMVSSLPIVNVLPEGLEEEIHELKAQVRRMGAVNPTAPEEYSEVLDRHTFLTTQVADLEEAARSLREVISELDEVMRREFNATFKEVATRFTENFTQLFGGGTARLMLTEPQDVSNTGVEIIARPPGKRQQTLALLSGGERSLTAVALIFALLEVSPPPFCILDEVDAMLDEANIKRFRGALEALSQHTQFIVITHNRGTIQAADTIYGVSMGDDSVSQVVSLQFDGDRIAAPDGSSVDIVKDG
ncbi:MAG: chromosome segregation protein SMC [Anaerolineae bacterium]